MPELPDVEIFKKHYDSTSLYKNYRRSKNQKYKNPWSNVN